MHLLRGGNYVQAALLPQQPALSLRAALPSTHCLLLQHHKQQRVSPRSGCTPRRQPSCPTASRQTPHNCLVLQSPRRLQRASKGSTADAGSSLGLLVPKPGATSARTTAVLQSTHRLVAAAKAAAASDYQALCNPYRNAGAAPCAAATSQRSTPVSP